MDRDTLRKVQLAQLEIAKDIKMVCDNNNINYFLDSGTLIGAVRHKGFIPWDDDLDIGMLRKDYERFLKVAQKELGDKYFLQNWDTDEHYPLPFSKVRRLGTVYSEAISTSVFEHKELFVDILPYDEMPSDVVIQKKIRRGLFFGCRMLFAKNGIKPWKHHNNKIYRFLSMCRYLPFFLLSAFYSREYIKEKCIKVMQNFDGSNTGYVYEQWGDMAGRRLVPISCFSEFIEIPFENVLFKVPQNYDGVLSAQYGDYMKLPPEDQRENRHQVVEVKL